MAGQDRRGARAHHAEVCDADSATGDCRPDRRRHDLPDRPRTRSRRRDTGRRRGCHRGGPGPCGRLACPKRPTWTGRPTSPRGPPRQGSAPRRPYWSRAWLSGLTRRRSPPPSPGQAASHHLGVGPGVRSSQGHGLPPIWPVSTSLVIPYDSLTLPRTAVVRFPAPGRSPPASGGGRGCPHGRYPAAGLRRP